MSAIATHSRNVFAAIAASAAFGACASSAPASKPADLISGVPCRAEPRYECPDAVECPAEIRTWLGPAADLKTQRSFFLDYPCDLKKGEDVTFILNIHGFGSIGNWQRSYFPALDQAEAQRVVVATPSALEGQPRQGRWGEVDDEYLANITDMVIDTFGREHISSFWLAGHSQGGMTSHRIVCSDYFASKVDGLLSLSGGRTGSPRRDSNEVVLPQCEYSHIYAIGEREAASALATDKSAWAEHYNCGAWTKQDDVVDSEAGYVTASDQSRGPSWGTTARPGTAEIHVFENCDNNMLVADVVRLEKGHTEGLEPNVTARIIGMMRAAPGGKIRNGG